jgi:hypothetical protein
MLLLALYFFLCILRDASNSLNGIKTLLRPILTNLTEAIAPVLGPQGHDRQHICPNMYYSLFEQNLSTVTYIYKCIIIVISAVLGLCYLLSN